jgi:hypothetical protein
LKLEKSYEKEKTINEICIEDNKINKKLKEK